MCIQYFAVLIYFLCYLVARFHSTQQFLFYFFVKHKVDGKICSSLVIKNYPICSACFVIYHFFCSVRIDSEENKPTDKN
ncbi:hypothetical protein ECDEC15D_3228 [Escherichia coli DEC15D]|nr:hypothetical protein ECDEC15D_3228 [Escherichia coli DEC15D]